MENLIPESENAGIWILEVGIFPENKGSLIINERLNFRKVGYREKIGKMDGVCRDIILLERRIDEGNVTHCLQHGKKTLISTLEKDPWIVSGILEIKQIRTWTILLRGSI